MEKQILGEVNGDSPDRDGERHAAKVTCLRFLLLFAECCSLLWVDVL